MSGFDAMVSAHMRGIVTSPLHRGETVVYEFAAGGTRSVQAMVYRTPRKLVKNRVLRHPATVVLPVHATEGVLEVVDGDRILLAIDKPGGEPVSCRITEVLLAAGGAIHVEVQAP